MKKTVVCSFVFLWYLKSCLEKRNENISSHFLGPRGLSDLSIRHPLCAVVHEIFTIPTDGVGKKIVTFLCSSLIQSVQSLEIDDNCAFVAIITKGTAGFSLATRLTHIRIALLDFPECVRLLNHIGSQLQSFIVTIASVNTYEPHSSDELKQVGPIFWSDISIDWLI